ncbi:MAG: UPF0149 family protein [Halothiobacillaceae bacterium]
MSNSQVSYEDVTDALDDAGAPLDAAEAQGALLGLFAATGAVSRRRWLDELIPEKARDGSTDHPGIRAMYDQAVAQLGRADNLGIDLCLPEDDTPFEERLVALRDWCQGYVYGFGAGGGGDPARLPEDAREVFEDLLEIGRLEADSAESEANERAYAELVEYLRVGVAVIHLALHPGALPDPGERLH